MLAVFSCSVVVIVIVVVLTYPVLDQVVTTIEDMNRRFVVSFT